MRKTIVPFLLLFSTFCFSDTLVTKDGTQHQGTVQSVTASSVSFRENGRVRRYVRTDVQAIEFGNTNNYIGSSNNGNYPNNNSGNYPNNNNGNYQNDNNRNYGNNANNNGTYRSGRGRLGYDNNVTIPAGTEIVVMPNENIDSANASTGQTFSADVAEDVMSNGQVVVPKGSEAELVLRDLKEQGKVTGSSELVLDLQSIRVNGRRYTISTEDVAQGNNSGLGANKRTATMVGGGAVLGTLIGAIAGGGKGAAIGAATGAAAGAGAQVLTRGKAVKVPAETKLRFKLDEPLDFRAAY
jgi:hypothetical protein